MASALLGIEHVQPAKPAKLAARGGAWFEIGTVRIHLGVEPDCRPAADPFGNRIELMEREG